jgi:hypothetical protein
MHIIKIFKNFQVSLIIIYYQFGRLNVSKKSLKIPKGYAETVNKTTDNAMANRKVMPNNDLQNTTQKGEY